MVTGSPINTPNSGARRAKCAAGQCWLAGQRLACLNPGGTQRFRAFIGSPGAVGPCIWPGEWAVDLRSEAKARNSHRSISLSEAAAWTLATMAMDSQWGWPMQPIGQGDAGVSTFAMAAMTRCPPWVFSAQRRAHSQMRTACARCQRRRMRARGRCPFSSSPPSRAPSRLSGEDLRLHMSPQEERCFNGAGEGRLADG
jgi:hypothetical protein